MPNWFAIRYETEIEIRDEEIERKTQRQSDKFQRGQVHTKLARTNQIALKESQNPISKKAIKVCSAI